MPKKRRAAESRESAPIPVERMPSPLSDAMIEKLRAAVDAAQRRHMPPRNPSREPEDGD
jgi:hypothetical protein